MNPIVHIRSEFGAALCDGNLLLAPTAPQHDRVDLDRFDLCQKCRHVARMMRQQARATIYGAD